MDPLEPPEAAPDEDDGPDIMELLDLLLAFDPEPGNLLGDLVGRVGRPISGWDIYMKTYREN